MFSSSFDDSPPVSPSFQSVGKVRIVSEDFYAEHERLLDLLRWRDAWGEPPTEHGEYLVQRLEFDGGYSRMVVYWNGVWPSTVTVTYWRPLGPLPSEGDK